MLPELQAVFPGRTLDLVRMAADALVHPEIPDVFPLVIRTHALIFTDRLKTRCPAGVIGLLGGVRDRYLDGPSTDAVILGCDRHCCLEKLNITWVPARCATVLLASCAISNP